VRSSIPGNRISRVLFCIHDGQMVALHGFIKKTQKTPPEDLALAKKRMKEVKRS
jgi:phage-related protein